MRTLRLFFFSPSAGAAPDVFAAFLVALVVAGVFAGALEAVEGGATAMAKMLLLLLGERVKESADDDI